MTSRKFSVDPRQVNVILNYPLPVLTYFFFVAFIILIGAYISSKDNITLYGGLLCIPIIVILSIIQIKKNDSKIGNIEKLKMPEGNIINTLRNIGQVRTALKIVFEKINSSTTDITQTFIRNNLIASGKDFLKEIIVKIPDENKRPFVKRIFIIFDPLDINFAQASLDLIDGINCKGSRYGDNLNNIFIYADNESQLKEIIPNMTLINDQCIITFPNRSLDDNSKFPRKLIQNLESNTSEGIHIVNKEFSDTYRKFLDGIKSQSLNNIKIQFWEADKLSYLYSIIYSISKELYSDSNIVKKICYLGIVGSIAKIIQKTENLDIHDLNISDFNDIDLLIIQNGISTDDWRRIISICNSVCRRYTIPNLICFVPFMESTPIKVIKKKSYQVEFPIHVLISDIIGCKNWDKFIAVDRIESNISFSWIINEDKDLSYFVPKTFTLEDFKSGVYGLDNCIKILNNELSFPYKDWNISGVVPFLELKYLDFNSSNIKPQFTKYALKWCTINFCNAIDSPFRLNNEYINCFEKAIKIISGIIPLKMLDKIKQVSFNSVDDVNEEVTDIVIKYLILLDDQIKKIKKNNIKF